LAKAYPVGSQPRRHLHLYPDSLRQALDKLDNLVWQNHASLM